MSRAWITFLAAFAVALLLGVFYTLIHSKTSSPIVSTYLTNSNLRVLKSSNDTNTADSVVEINTKEINWKEIPRLPSPPKGEFHDKWIVLTTINTPTADVKKLAGIKGWKVVVVGDTKTPADWRSNPESCYL